MLEPPVLHRPRLHALLSDSVARARLTLVIAGPGCGKTIAVEGWAHSHPKLGQPLWLTMNPGHNDAAQLDRDLRVACGNDPALLVVDDVHTLQEPRAVARLGELLSSGPPRLKVMLIGRADPPLHLHRVRLTGGLREIRARDLAFDAAETNALFGLHAIALHPALEGLVMRRTEGWVAGVAMAAMSLNRTDVAFGLRNFTGELGGVADYLEAELLGRQQPGVRRFLLQTSVLDEITGESARALTGEVKAPQILHQLALGNAPLVSVGDGDQWRYRYHPLLRRMLLRRLSVEQPEAVPELRRRAAVWLERNGSAVAAVRMARLAEDEQLFERIVLTSALPEYLAAPIGPMEHERGSFARTALVAVQHLHARLGDALTCDLALMTKQQQHSGDVGAAAVVVKALLHSAGSFLAGDCGNAANHAREALRRLGSTDIAGIPAAQRYRAIAHAYLGSALAWDGRRLDADQHLRAGATQASAAGLRPVGRGCQAHLALQAALSGALRAAGERATAVLESGTRGFPAAQAELALGVARLRQGSLDDAARHIARIEGGDGLLGHAARLAGAELALARGAPAKAAAAAAAVQRWMTAERISAGMLQGWADLLAVDARLEAGGQVAVAELLAGRAKRAPLTPPERIRLARAALLAGQPSRAEAALGPVLEEEPDPLSTVEGWLLHAVLQQNRRREGRALDAIGRALDAAESDLLRLPFQRAGEPVTKLLYRYRETTGTSRILLDELLAPASVPAVEPLTDRELTVLRYAATLRANREIGQDLYVTVNTVKAHLKTIYRKLGVNSRRQAVERARDLGML